MKNNDRKKGKKGIEVSFNWHLKGVDYDLSENYSSQDFKYKSIKEINKFSGLGEHIALALWTKDEGNYENSFEMFKTVFWDDNISIDSETKVTFFEEYDSKTAYFDVLGWCIYQFTHIVFNILHRYGSEDKDWKKKVPLKSEVLDAICNNENNVSYKLQDWVDGIVELVNEVFNAEEHKESALQDLYDAINANISNSKLLPDYLEQGNRCVAKYITDNKRKVISFSSYVDCMDDKIKNKFGFTNDNTVFIDKLQKVAKMLNAELATLVGDVAKFIIKNGTTIQKIRLKYATLQSVKNQDYSCCERKIFAHLDKGNNQIEDGVMVVKLVPCEKCILGILNYKGYFENARRIRFKSNPKNRYYIKSGYHFVI